LRSGESDLALAGGVNLILDSDLTVAFTRSGMLSPDGRCKTFADGADGFARGEGCGVVVLKRLKDAIADANRIYGVIRGSAVNQDGPSSALSAPNGPAQEAVIRAALADGGLVPSDTKLISDTSRVRPELPASSKPLSRCTNASSPRICIGTHRVGTFRGATIQSP
jgi:acyl transferase domain-containing protein